MSLLPHGILPHLSSGHDPNVTKLYLVKGKTVQTLRYTDKPPSGSVTMAASQAGDVYRMLCMDATGNERLIRWKDTLANRLIICIIVETKLSLTSALRLFRFSLFDSSSSTTIDCLV